MKIPFFLVTGFLGSGKTTLLKRFLKQYSGGKRIGVIQNEFAPASIDGIELKAEGKDFHILEINNGSVFCVCLLGDFIKSLSNFIDDKKPDIIILESSGLSDPIAIAEMLQLGDVKNKVYLSHTWCVADASNFEKLDKLGTQVRHQIRIADTVVINKTDLVNDNLELIKSRIIELNPFAQIEQTSFCNINFDDIFQPFQLTPVAIKRADENAMLESGGRPDVQVKVVKTGRKIPYETLRAFIDRYTSQTYRIKGYINSDEGCVYAVQTSGSSKNIIRVDHYSGQSLLILMGHNLDTGQIRKDLNL